MNTGLDQLKKAKEEEFFHKQQQEQLQSIRERHFDEEQQQRESELKFKAFQEGHSPLTGAKLFKARVGHATVLDCPEEGSLMLTYQSIMELVEAAKCNNEDVLKVWQAFLGKTA